MTARAKPMPKRYPNRYAIISRLWMPDGAMFGLEGPLDDDTGRLVLALLAHSKITPEQREKIRALSFELLPGKQPKDGEVERILTKDPDVTGGRLP